jgi:hypothetical protein
MPAAVVHSHHSLFAAVRAVRLTEPRQHGPVREMSAFPQAHTAGVIILNEALCNGYELMCVSQQGGAFADSGEVILDAIERWRPTAVFGFAVTWAELARFDLTARDVSSVRIWSNTGDSAHEAHPPPGRGHSHYEFSRNGVVTRSNPVQHTPGPARCATAASRSATAPPERYDRCVGRFRSLRSNCGRESAGQRYDR